MKPRYLERHGNQWRVIVKVSRKARPLLAKAHLKELLHTDSLPKAEAMKWPVIAKLKGIIAEAERQTTMKQAGGVDALAAEALEWRGHLTASPVLVIAGDEEGFINPAHEHLDDRADEISTVHGLEAARTFSAIALGRETPLAALLPAFFMEAALKPRTEADYRRAIEAFALWAGEQLMAGTIEATTRKTAGRYISEALIGRGADGRTVNKHVSSLSAYWKWLMKRGHADANPWQGQALPKRASVTVEGERYKRPFTDNEIKLLMSGDPHKTLGGPIRKSPAWADLADVMRIAALSGLRIEEIAQLTVKNCEGGVFDIRRAKTLTGMRKVPIHPDLAAMIEKRKAGRDEAAFLFSNIPTPQPGSKLERSMPWVKAFVRYRRSLGLDNREDGKRQTRTDFHSFRRWFITKAEQAGIPRDTIAFVVGHKRDGMTLGLYSGGPSWEQLEGCVAAVRLPE